MITVVSLNSAIDRRVVVEKLVPGALVRATEVSESAGGKGLNVAGAAAEMGARVTVVGFAPGARGAVLRVAMRSRGIAARWIDVPGETRMNLAIFSNGRVTEILEPGPRVPAAAARATLRAAAAMAKRSRVVAMSGSLPPGLPENFYARIIRACRGAVTILDTSRGPLRKGIEARPAVLRINEEELGGIAIRQVAALIETIVVSRGARGATVAHRGRFGTLRVPKVRAVNPVGAGDCMAGGIAAALDAGKSIDEALVWGGACATASVLTPQTARVRRKDARALLKEVSLAWD